jgi:hypothetical protein
MKNRLTLAGIEPATFRFVAQHLNHCATSRFAVSVASGDNMAVANIATRSSKQNVYLLSNNFKKTPTIKLQKTPKIIKSMTS